MTVTWTDRNGFIEMAARLLEQGEPLEVAFYDLDKYCVPYIKGDKPTLGRHQLSSVKISITKCRHQLARDGKCQPRLY